jgi:hypothetical protein
MTRTAESLSLVDHAIGEQEIKRIVHQEPEGRLGRMNARP